MSKGTTPMMEQYRKIRKQLPAGTILFFRLGDFYEMFFEDAREAAAILDIALTKRHNVPMCGVPYHAAQNYLAKLLKAGKKVAICDQVEDPAQAKGIVKREVRSIVTPGTVLDEPVLETKQHNYLAGIARGKKTFGLALLDLSTGSFWLEESRRAEDVADSLTKYAPSECVVPEEAMEEEWLTSILGPGKQLTSCYEGWTFEPTVAVDTLLRHFRIHSLEGFGCSHSSPGTAAAGAVLHYVQNELHRNVDHIQTLRVLNPSDYMLLDDTTTANLELIASRGLQNSGFPTTLLAVLDKTTTAMGGRLLRDWVLRPLNQVNDIAARHEAVENMAADNVWRKEIRAALSELKDLERLISRLHSGGNGRDLQSLAVSLDQLPSIKKLITVLPAPLTQQLEAQIQTFPDLHKTLAEALVDEPPATLKEGGLFRPGYHEELDELRAAATQGRQWLTNYQADEQEKTGIKSLKIRHNKVFGYYIEVTKSNLAQVPEHYIRKQTLVNAERFITPELKEYENKILGAHERAVALEHELFAALRQKAVEQTHAIQTTAAAVAQLDVLSSLAECARQYNYCRPVIDGSTRLEIKNGRHPVIEQMPDADRFVPNDTRLDTGENQLIIITGPNMAGKSTYIRQVALIVIMAQMGSFVPASEAFIGVVDRVFTRVGASDDLTRGRSTFMVEMQETANILNNATPRSLLVLDEIGRGTSTFDGISIAWAVAEYLHNNEQVRAKTLFATHYHELTDLAVTLPGVQNYNVLVREKNDTIVFLRKIVKGPADKSYGIQVAQLAGLPEPVILRAREILGNLEEGEFEEGGQPHIAKKNVKKKPLPINQLALFDD